MKLSKCMTHIQLTSVNFQCPFTTQPGPSHCEEWLLPGQPESVDAELEFLTQAAVTKTTEISAKGHYGEHFNRLVWQYQCEVMFLYWQGQRVRTNVLPKYNITFIGCFEKLFSKKENYSVTEAVGFLLITMNRKEKQYIDLFKSDVFAVV